MLRRALPLALVAALAACKNPEPCPTPLETCNGQCVDVQSNRSHCGGCGIACRAGETCTAARCAPDPRGPCPDRILGAFVTFERCGEAVKLWIRHAPFVDEAVGYVGSTAPARTPVVTVLAGADCDGQWDWNASDAASGAATPVFSSAPPTGCDVCPSAIQANVVPYVTTVGKWCPATILAVDRVP